MMNVFTYWEEPPSGRKWSYIQHCLDTIRFHCLDGCLYHHITAGNIERYIPDGLLHPSWSSIKELGVKSDCVRAALLHLYGGLYVDADTLMVRSPKHLDTGHDFAGMQWSTPPKRIIAGYSYCCKGSKVAERWVENINEKLSQGKTGWCELGEQCLTPAVESVDHSRVLMWDISTFLPIEIDTKVSDFFLHKDRPVVIGSDTVAVGLNHSWMTRKYPKVIAGLSENKRRRNSYANPRKSTVLEETFRDLTSAVQPIRIGVCVPTFRRPELLGHLIHCFEQQTYENCCLVAYDDHGELKESSGENWKIVSRNTPHATLGEKRNAIAGMMQDVDAYAFWDDDEIILPHALDAISHGLSRADFTRPSQILVRSGSRLMRTKTSWLADESDKAYQCAWGVTKSAFDSVGGYPSVSLGEDLLLAKRLSEAGVSESDPVAMGWSPWLVASPYSNEHFSWNCKDYDKWKEITNYGGSEVVVAPHGFSFDPLSSVVHNRPFKGDWYKEEVR
jgi:hypothetical protein